jgi:hypothetical protein
MTPPYELVHFIGTKRLWKQDRHFPNKTALETGPTLSYDAFMKISTLVLLLTLASSAGAPAPASGLPFIEDDYAKARIEANRRKLPLFVDVWAPW